MKKQFKWVVFLLVALSFTGCQKMQQNKLFRQMKEVAKVYLQQEEITDYENLTISSVDTLTEYGYAKLTSELLDNMSAAYDQMYWQETDSVRRNAIGLYLGETYQIKDDMEALIENGDLLTEGVLLYMVTGKYEKDGDTQEFMFLVNPDKKTLHTLNPFADNLLYKEE